VFAKLVSSELTAGVSTYAFNVLKVAKMTAGLTVISLILL
jgi:hypothetical protein